MATLQLQRNRPAVRDSKQRELLEQKLAHRLGRCVVDYQLIEANDRIMVAISGGKDSYTLLHLLKRLQRASPVPFELLAVHLDQQQPGFAADSVRLFLEQSGVPFEIVSRDTYSIVIEKTRPGQATCFMCSRLRRGILYKTAQRLGCSSIALGHHRDDAIETLMLNLLFSGQMKSMPAHLRADDGLNRVIRPLITIPESMIVEFAGMMDWPIAPCVVCDSQKDLKRREVKQLLQDLEQRYPGSKGSMFNALGNLKPDFLLDREFFSVESD